MRRIEVDGRDRSPVTTRLGMAVVFVVLGLLVGACGRFDDRSATVDTEVDIDEADLGEADRPTLADRLGRTDLPTPSTESAALLFDPELEPARSLSHDDPSHWHRTTPLGPRAAELTADPSFPTYGHLDLPPAAAVATVVGAGVSSTAEPGDGVPLHWFANPTQFGGDRVFLVIDRTSSPEYIKVSLPLKPNGQEGWIPRNQVVISEVEHRAVVDLADDSLTVWDGDDIIVQTKAVTGKPATPTPVGVFYVRDIIAHSNPSGAYGPYIVALSGFSETLDTFAGGLPAIAIHGTNNPGLIGQEQSNGCIRVPNDLITTLAAAVPLGTPVTIVA